MTTAPIWTANGSSNLIRPIRTPTPFEEVHRPLT